MRRPLLSTTLVCLSHLAFAAEKPNIIYILADDLGYGDVQCLNPGRGKIPTPHMDQVAAEGMTFTDAHTSSSVCTPTRYSIMTGHYNWRTKLQKGVLNGYGEALITEDRLTVPAYLRDNGYATAMIGKWHLGLGIETLDGKPATPLSNRELAKMKRNQTLVSAADLSNIDWQGTITGGPVDLGFDSWYGISASLDFPPYVWIRDRHFTAKGTHIKAFHRLGPASKDFEAIDVLDKLAAESVKFITDYDKEKPFFAYIPLPSPHTPIVPTSKWQGKSGLGDYGYFVMQTDDFVGQVVKALNDKGLSDNTLLIVTSDNGCSNTLTCQVDLLATCAELVGEPLSTTAGEDSDSILAAFHGNEPEFTCKGIIRHSVSGHSAYREGNYKLILARGSGGWTRPNEQKAKELDHPKAQLYDLDADPSELNNLYLEQPKIAKALLAQFTKNVNAGTTIKRKKASNDINKIRLWKTQ